jgi:hypothetical protein
MRRLPGLPMASDGPSRLPVVLLAGVAIVLVTRSAHAEVYVYKDDAGANHFTNVPGDPRQYRLYRGALDPTRRSSTHVPVAPGDRGPMRGTCYGQWIAEAAALYQIPEALIRAIVRQESQCDPRAVSRAGAQGLMQLMPGTAKRLNVRDPFDPRENLFGGVRLLRELAREFHGNLTLMVAAYNAGAEAVVRFSGMPPYPETRDYVAAVAADYRRYRALGRPAAASR